MRPALFALACALAFVLSEPAVAQPPVLHGPQKPAEEVLAAETSFARRFAEIGLAKGMGEFLDPDFGIAFAGADPVRAAGAGQFTLTDPSGEQGPVRGRYVTVWRKSKDGRWRALMDIGAPDVPAPPPPGAAPKP